MRHALDMLLQKSSIRFHCWLRLAFGPFNGRIHCRTSPKVRTLREVSTVRTKRKSAPFRVGYVRVCGPIRPVAGRHSLLPSSSTLCPVPLPCGRDTTYVGGIGLTQLSVKKHVVWHGWSLYPGGRIGCRRSHDDEAVLPTYHLVMACQPLWPFAVHGVLL